MKSLAKFAAIGAVVAASSIMASATTLTPGSTVNAAPLNFGFISNAATPIAGPIVAGTFTGTYSEFVIYDSDNVFNGSCSGPSGDCLTFVLEINSTLPTDSNGIEHVSAGSATGFLGYNLNVGYETMPNGTVPVSVDESPYGTVEFNFTGADAIPPGSAADYMVIETNASNFTSGNFAAIDSTTATVAGYVPAAATPEPNSLLLLGTGLLGAAGMLFVRRRQADSIL